MEAIGVLVPHTVGRLEPPEHGQGCLHKAWGYGYDPSNLPMQMAIVLCRLVVRLQAAKCM